MTHLATPLPALLAQTAPPAAPAAYELSAWGWLIMILSIGFVTGLFAWCIYHVLRESTPRKVHSPVDIEPRDGVED